MRNDIRSTGGRELCLGMTKTLGPPDGLQPKVSAMSASHDPSNIANDPGEGSGSPDVDSRDRASRRRVRRDQRLTISLPTHDAARLKAAAQHAGMSVSQYVRDRVLKAEPRRRGWRAEHEQCLSALNNLVVEMRNIRELLGATGELHEDLDSVIKEGAETWDHLMRVIHKLAAKDDTERAEAEVD